MTLIVDKWFDTHSITIDDGYSTVAYDDLPDLVEMLSEWLNRLPLR